MEIPKVKISDLLNILNEYKEKGATHVKIRFDEFTKSGKLLLAPLKEDEEEGGGKSKFGKVSDKPFDDLL